MTQPTSLGRAAAACLLTLPLATGLVAQAPSAASVAKVTEFATLLASKKLEAFAMKDPRSSADKPRYIAALLIPNSQLLLVTAMHTKFMDVEYYLHKKDFMKAYQDLNTNPASVERFFVEDVLADGLVAVPKRNAPADAVKIGTNTQNFDGDFIDPKRRNPNNKITQDVYLKNFAEADQRYAAALDQLIEHLKKVG